MFSLTMDQFTWLAAGVSLVGLLVVVFLTRPGLRRLAGALLGGFFLAVLASVLDRVAFSLSLWRYPFTHSAFGPPGFYVAAGLFYGAGMALIGWRITRRFGRPGVLIFLSCFAVYGPLRDSLGSAMASRAGLQFLVFAPGSLPVLADALCWVVCVGLTLLIMRLVAGPAQADRLALY
jgi:hypothetical protein